MICDLCSSPNVKWKYPCPTFTSGISTPDLASTSFGEWAACDECHALIERNDRVGLAVRSADALIAKHSALLPHYADLMADLMKLQGEFMNNRLMPKPEEHPEVAPHPPAVVLGSRDDIDQIIQLAEAGCSLQEALAYFGFTQNGEPC